MAVFLRANIASLIASFSDYLITILLVQLAHADKFAASAIGTICGGIINFLIGRSWAFRASGQNVKKQAVRYFLVWVGNLFLNMLGFYLLNKLAGAHYILAKVVTSLLVAVGWNYPLQKRYVFLKIIEK